MVGVVFINNKVILNLNISDSEVTLRSELANRESLIVIIIKIMPNSVIGINFITNFASINNRLRKYKFEDLRILFAIGKLNSINHRNIVNIKAGFAKVCLSHSMEVPC